MSPLIVHCLLPAPEKNPGRCEVSPKNPSELFNSFARNFSQHGDQGNITSHALDRILEAVNETIGNFLTRKKVREVATTEYRAFLGNGCFNILVQTRCWVEIFYHNLHLYFYPYLESHDLLEMGNGWLFSVTSFCSNCDYPWIIIWVRNDSGKRCNRL